MAKITKWDEFFITVRSTNIFIDTFPDFQTFIGI